MLSVRWIRQRIQVAVTIRQQPLAMFKFWVSSIGQ
jgi:hypothetical protein